MKIDIDYKMHLLNGILMIYESFRGQIELADEIVDSIMNEYVKDEMYEEAAIVLQARTLVQESTNERNCTIFPRDVEI